MITFENVSKKFPSGNLALKKATFEIADRDFVFLVGPSGAGKTTILKLILRDFAPSSGRLLVDNFDLSSPKFNHVADLRRTIGVVFQDFKVLADKNIAENIAIGLKVLGWPQGQIQNEVQEALALVGLSGRELMFPAQMSAGELQRVAIARAIVGERSIILGDEPTGNLDPKTTWEIMKIFKKIEGKRTVILATHNVDIVNSLQKRVIALKGGEIIKDQKKGGYEI